MACKQQLQIAIILSAVHGVSICLSCFMIQALGWGTVSRPRRVATVVRRSVEYSSVNTRGLLNYAPSPITVAN
ncbi:hypothetical protein B0H14DRAFT_1090327 [Mycena olivaceomarginata]|nr:hypothetical protein B0H14DRAFT_1090327 [Mycena olivaceomarginata]